jgi:ribosome maturation factor RimP
MSIAAELLQELEPLVLGADALIEDLAVTAAGKRRLVTVLVDHPTRFLTLDEVTVLSRLISERLDQVELMGDAPFTLEVSSPGVDRPLTKDWQWKKNVGRLVKVVRTDGQVISGRIEGFEANPLIDGEEIPLDSIKRATIEIEFKKKGE